MTLSNNNIQYPLVMYGWKENPIIYFGNTKKDIFINFYETAPDFGYINLAKNHHYHGNLYERYDLYKGNAKVNQIEGKNRIKIHMDSLTYLSYPDIFQYYLFINVFDYFNFNYSDMYSIITNKKKLSESNNELMVIIEDNGNNEIFEYEIDINIKLKEKDPNSIILILVKKDINLVEDRIQKTSFDYKNHTMKKKDNNINYCYYLFYYRTNINNCCSYNLSSI